MVKKIFNYFTSLLMTFVMLVLPITNVFASNPGAGYGRIQINGATSVTEVDNASSVTATFEHGTVVFTGTGLYSAGNQIYGNGVVTVTATPAANYSVSLWADGSDLHAVTANYDLSTTNFVNMDAIFNGSAPSTGNTTATMNVTAGAGTYAIQRQTQSGVTTVNQNYDADGEILINGTRWDRGNSITYNSDSNKVTFTFETLWINRFYDTIVINGTSYRVSDYLDFDDRTEWLVANHGSQTISFDIPNVDKAASYNIVMKHGENNGTRYMATFLWTADPAQAGSHNYIGHSRLEFVKAVYTVGNTTYTVTENDLRSRLTRDGNFDVANSADGFMSYGVLAGVNFDDGNLTLPGGARVTMRVVPEYGYQVTSVNDGGNFTTTDSGVSEFTITVADGTAGYFKASVTPVDDEVVSNSNKVAGGNVALGTGELTSGTAVLSVVDVDPNEEKIRDFEQTAGSDYKIKTYLDINLAKVLYKGTSTDVWSEDIHHLNRKALITLQLEDGVDVENLVLIHNIDDGDEFEIIEIESYDKENNTISFYTDSFSGYAIASSTVANPNTYDNIGTLAGVGMISISLLIGSVYVLRKQEN